MVATDLSVASMISIESSNQLEIDRKVKLLAYIAHTGLSAVETIGGRFRRGA